MQTKVEEARKTLLWRASEHNFQVVPSLSRLLKWWMMLSQLTRSLASHFRGRWIGPSPSSSACPPLSPPLVIVLSNWPFGRLSLAFLVCWRHFKKRDKQNGQSLDYFTFSSDWFALLCATLTFEPTQLELILNQQTKNEPIKEQSRKETFPSLSSFHGDRSSTSVDQEAIS